ncbi:MAG: CDGSH iron-sulfur domain-containing protein [Polyangiaceae bacterium]|nr:CDGSH iron-sulfur domain-containing protein [Polyangiaceae bacterium]
MPAVNVARVRENGPLALHAQMSLEGHGAMLRATLCRCGASRNKPFCDGSHAAAPFAATGLQIRGNLELCSGTGRTVDRVASARLCRCGGSSQKPFCDGTHARIGFRSELVSGRCGARRQT